jgi:hypothetical protein
MNIVKDDVGFFYYKKSPTLFVLVMYRPFYCIFFLVYEGFRAYYTMYM